MIEEWKKVVGFENYEVSNLGRVKRSECTIIYSDGMKCFYKEKILKQDTPRGYKRITLSKNNKTERYQVHRLVAYYFIDNPLDKPCVNHINGIKEDNRVVNLEWCTYSENEKHSYRYLNKINPIRKLNINDALFIRNNAIKGRGGNVKKLANLYNVSITTVCNIMKNKYYV